MPAHNEIIFVRYYNYTILTKKLFVYAHLKIKVFDYVLDILSV